MVLLSASWIRAARIVWLGVVGCLALGIAARAAAVPSVQVNLARQRFEAKGENVELPFDVVFDIKGTAPKGVKQVSVHYCHARNYPDENGAWSNHGARFKPKARKHYYKNRTARIKGQPAPSRGSVLCGSRVVPHQPVIWSVAEPSGGQEFALTVGPLHANAPYEFRFEFSQRASDLDKTEADKIRASLIALFTKELDAVFEDDFASSTEMDTLATNLNDTARAELAKAMGISRHAIQDPVIDPAKEPYDGLAAAIVQASKDLESIERRLSGACPSPPADPGTCGDLDLIEDWLCVDYRRPNPCPAGTREPCPQPRSCAGAQLVRALRELGDKKGQMSPDLRRRWEEPLLPPHIYVSMERLAEAVVPAVELDRGLGPILDLAAATYAVDPGTMTTAQEQAAQHDLKTFDLLERFFRKLSTPPFRRSGLTPVLDQAFSQQIAMLAAHFQGVAVSAKEKTAKNEELAKLKDGFPSALATAVITTTVRVSGVASGVVAGKFPRVGVELGLGYSEDLGGGFSYTGANFFLVPVNSHPNEVTDQFRHSDRWKKRFSFLLGVTLSEADEVGSEDLVASGNLVVGAGFRLWRFFRLNAGALVFEATDPNPLISDTTVKGRAFVAVSADVDLSNMISAVSKALTGAK